MDQQIQNKEPKVPTFPIKLKFKEGVFQFTLYLKLEHKKGYYFGGKNVSLYSICHLPEPASK
jgi:hypothetical protein